MTSSCTCPTCGAPMREQRVAVTALLDLPLGRIEARALAVMVRAYPQAVSHETLLLVLYGDDPNGGPLAAAEVIRTIMRRLRSKLEPFGWTIPKGRTSPGAFAGRRLALLEA